MYSDIVSLPNYEASSSDDSRADYLEACYTIIMQKLELDTRVLILREFTSQKYMFHSIIS